MDFKGSRTNDHRLQLQTIANVPVLDLVTLDFLKELQIRCVEDAYHIVVWHADHNVPFVDSEPLRYLAAYFFNDPLFEISILLLLTFAVDSLVIYLY